MIDFQKLKYFVGIVDYNFSLSIACKKLNVTQPTLSLTIDYLEKHFNVQLFIKEKNKFVALTSAGRILYEDAKELIEQSNRTFIKMTNPSDYTGELSIAIPPVTQPIVCPKVITLFKKKHPNIKITIFEEGAFIGKSRLINGELDFGFMTVFQNDIELDGFPVFESDVVAMFKKGHPLTSKDTVSTRDVSQYEIIGLDETFTLYHMIDVYFNNLGTKLNYFHLTSRWDYALEIVSNCDNNFIAVLPKPLLSIYQNRLITYKKFDNKFKWRVTLSYKKDRTLRKECIIFMDFVKEFFNIQ